MFPLISIMTFLSVSIHPFGFIRWTFFCSLVFVLEVEYFVSWYVWGWPTSLHISAGMFTPIIIHSWLKLLFNSYTRELTEWRLCFSYHTFGLVTLNYRLLIFFTIAVFKHWLRIKIKWSKVNLQLFLEVSFQICTVFAYGFNNDFLTVFHPLFAQIFCILNRFHILQITFNVIDFILEMYFISIIQTLIDGGVQILFIIFIIF